MVRRAGEPEADTGFDVERVARVIDHGKHLMRLIASRQEMANRSEIRIMFRGHGPSLGDIVSDASRRREIQILKPVIRGVENRIHKQIPLT